jgi:hypothetical protein
MKPHLYFKLRKCGLAFSISIKQEKKSNNKVSQKLEK